MFTFCEKLHSCLSAATDVQWLVSNHKKKIAPTTPAMAIAMMPHGIFGHGTQSSA